MKLVKLLTFLAILIPVSKTLGFDYGDTKLPVPQREHSIIVTKEGFYPQNFSVFEGELVRFYVTSTTDLPSCFMIPKKDIYLSASQGQVSEGEAMFERPGKVKFFCPTGKVKGEITVLPRKKKAMRKVASQKKVLKVWRPKDLPEGW